MTMMLEKNTNLHIDDPVLNNSFGCSTSLRGLHDSNLESLRFHNLCQTLLQHVVALEVLTLQLVQQSVPAEMTMISKNSCGVEASVSPEVLKEDLSELLLP